MKNMIFIALVMLSSFAGYSQNSIFDFKVKDIDGKTFDFSTLKGKKIMIVNVASKCGYTPQYAELEELYNKYKASGFTIIAFPANNFGAQEPGTDSEIKSFCTKNYGVTFPVMSKISVKGQDIHPLYKWLTQKSLNGVTDAPVEWNFQKFLIDEGGRLRIVLPSKVKPLSGQVTDWIEGK